MLAITPPIRINVIKTCKMVYYTMASDDRGNPCAVPVSGTLCSCARAECKDPTCEGNVIYIPKYGLSSGVTLTWNHHKTGHQPCSSNAGAAFNTTIQDPRVVSILQYWWLHGWTALYWGCHPPPPPHDRHLLLNYDCSSKPPTPHNGQRFATWVRSKCSTHPNLKPSFGRHVWSTILSNLKVQCLL